MKKKIKYSYIKIMKENYVYSILKNQENELPLFIVHNNNKNNNYYKFLVAIINFFVSLGICALVWYLL